MASAPHIFLSAAEPSGDLHAASLMRAIHDASPDARFTGIAGPHMQRAGCRAIADLTSRAAMLGRVLGSVPDAVAALWRTSDAFSRDHFDAAVVVDSPMLNFHVAARAKARGIAVLYYIAPQLWAWGQYRMHKLRARVDRLAVILPFEQRYFRDLGFDAVGVGHPLIDALAGHEPSATRVERIRASGSPVLAIMPGSRTHAVREVLPGQLEVARAVRARFPRVHVGVSVAGDAVAATVAHAVHAAGARCTEYRDENAALLAAADLTLVASGTATLEVAYYGSPMIVMYNGSKVMYHLLGRWLVNLDHLSLVNIIAGERVAPEFMPYYDSTAPIAATAIALLGDQGRLRRMRARLHEVAGRLGAPGASARTARVVLEMVAAQRH